MKYSNAIEYFYCQQIPTNNTHFLPPTIMEVPHYFNIQPAFQPLINDNNFYVSLINENQ